MMYFAAALTAALKKAGMSQSELARRIPCRRSHVSNWCAGRHQPTPHILDRINIILKTRLTLARTVNTKDVARALGMSERRLQRAMLSGQYRDLGEVLSSPSGKRHIYRFYPVPVAQRCGI